MELEVIALKNKFLPWRPDFNAGGYWLKMEVATTSIKR